MSMAIISGPRGDAELNGDGHARAGHRYAAEYDAYDSRALRDGCDVGRVEPLDRVAHDICHPVDRSFLAYHHDAVAHLQGEA